MNGTIVDLLRDASIDELPLDVQASAFYQGTAAAHDFANQIIIPQLSGLLRLSSAGQEIAQKDKAIIATYYRMFAIVGSSLILDKALYYQTVSASARTMIELLFDLHFLTRDLISNPVDKFWLFPDYELYRVSKIITKYTEENEESEVVDTAFHDYLVEHTEDEINALVIRLWGLGKKGKPKKPKHWTGYSFSERAEKLRGEYYEQYINFNAMLSWNVHSGSIGHVGSSISHDTFKTIYGHSHGLIQAAFLEGTSIACQELDLGKAIDWIDSTVAELKLVPGKYLLDREIELIRDKTREGLT